MISYEFYKFLHFTFIFLAIALFFSNKPQTKFQKNLRLFTYFFIFVAGMGLIARMGFKHSEPFPLWIKLKFLMVFILTAIHYLKWSEIKSLKINEKALNFAYYIALIATVAVVQLKWH